MTNFAMNRILGKDDQDSLAVLQVAKELDVQLDINIVLTQQQRGRSQPDQSTLVGKGANKTVEQTRSKHSGQTLSSIKVWCSFALVGVLFTCPDVCQRTLLGGAHQLLVSKPWFKGRGSSWTNAQKSTDLAFPNRDPSPASPVANMSQTRFSQRNPWSPSNRSAHGRGSKQRRY